MWGLEARGRFSKLSRYGLKSGSPQLGGIPRDPLSGGFPDSTELARVRTVIP